MATGLFNTESHARQNHRVGSADHSLPKYDHILLPLITKEKIMSAIHKMSADLAAVSL